MPTNGFSFAHQLDARPYAFLGDGYFAGEAPGEDAELDGRARILNVPSRVRIRVYERKTMRTVCGVLSNPDGTWRINYLDRSRYYTVIGFDELGQVNAAIQDWVQPAPMD